MMKRKRWTIPERITKPQIQDKATRTSRQPQKLWSLTPKLILLVNGLVAGMGYLFISGYLGRLGIEVAELDISLPSLLLYGYIFTLDTLTIGSKLILLSVTSTLMGLLTWLLHLAVSDAYPDSNSNIRDLVSIPIGAVLTFLLLLAPALIFNSGADNALRTTLRKMSLEDPGSAIRIHTIDTPNGKVEGTLVIADQRYTYLRSGNRVYKIANDTQKVIRTITFSETDAEPAGK